MPLLANDPVVDVPAASDCIHFSGTNGASNGKKSRAGPVAIIGNGVPQALRDLLSQYPYVDGEWYRAAYPDVRDQGLDPVEHYIVNGAVERRRPNRYFDPYFYRAQAKELPGDQAELVHYFETGWWQGLQPSPDFDTVGYLEAYPDVAEAGLEPLAHFLRFGDREGRVVFPGKPSAKLEAAAAFPDLLAPKYRKLLVPIRHRPEAGSSFDPDRLSIAWIIPDFEPGAGGHMAIFKAVYWLEFLGHDVTIWIDYPNRRNSAPVVREAIIRYFQPVKANVRLLSERAVIRADAVIATDHQTVWSAVRHAAAKKTFYFVQDLEPLFFPMGSDAILADKTYDLGLYCLCSSPWLAGKMRARGSEAAQFIYPADPAVYFPGTVPRPEAEPPLIAVYARFSTSRRAVELALVGLTELARRGERFRVALFGQKLDDDAKWPFPVEYCGVLSERELGELFRRADIGLVFSATNYSIAAVEMMACGLPVVDLRTESTLATYPADVATLVDALPDSVATGVEQLLHDPDKRGKQIAAARKWAAESTWPAISRMISETFVAQLEKAGFAAQKAAPAVMQRTTRVAVAIPTLNAGPDFARVLDAVLSQTGPYELEVLCIDSGSTDGTLAHIAERKQVRLIEIPGAEFNHGGTRNLAIERSDADYVAFLTQDALPASDRWLFDLSGLLRSTPNAALAFGRHLPYEAASPFVRRDLELHFDRFRDGPLAVSGDTERELFEAGHRDWLSFLRFSSDNNSCIAKRIWETLPLPEIDFGEDQLWAWQVIQGGYAKVYVDAAAVYHSHNYGIDETRCRARTEAGFYKHVFGIDMGVADEKAFADALRRLNRTDLLFAIKKGLPRALTETQFALNRARLEGYRRGMADSEIVYRP